MRFVIIAVAAMTIVLGFILVVTDEMNVTNIKTNRYSELNSSHPMLKLVQKW